MIRSACHKYLCEVILHFTIVLQFAKEVFLHFTFRISIFAGVQARVVLKSLDFRHKLPSEPWTVKCKIRNFFYYFFSQRSSVPYRTQLRNVNWLMTSNRKIAEACQSSLDRVMWNVKQMRNGHFTIQNLSKILSSTNNRTTIYLIQLRNVNCQMTSHAIFSSSSFSIWSVK